MGPRYLDPETPDEQGMAGESRPDILYFANSSVMEYQIERFGETVGLGTYDEHVMNALYGRVLETIDDQAHGGFATGDQMKLAPRVETQLTEQDRITRVHVTFGLGTWPTHYTEVARQLKVFDPARDCRVATGDEMARAAWRIVHGKVCAPPPRDHAAWLDFLSDALPSTRGAAGQPAPYWHTRKGAATGGDRVRWWYRWGMEHNSHLHVNDSDSGANPYEVAVNTSHRFDVMYPFTYFRRQNREYWFRQIPLGVANRYFERVRGYHWVVANQTAFLRSFASQTYDAMATDDDWHKPYLVADTELFNLLARVVLMPEPGDFSEVASAPDQIHTLFDVPQFPDNAPRFSVGLVDGRFIGEEYDASPSGDSVAPWVTPSQGRTPSPKLLDLTASHPTRSSDEWFYSPTLVTSSSSARSSLPRSSPASRRI
jgi:hypothetical protein